MCYEFFAEITLKRKYSLKNLYKFNCSVGFSMFLLDLYTY